MTAPEVWRVRVASAVGAVREADWVGPGLWRVMVDGGAGGPGSSGDRSRPTAPSVLAVKVGDGVAAEGEGLRRLASALAGRAGDTPAVGVPRVVLSEPDLLVTEWVAEGPRTPAAEEALGRGLASLHGSGAEWWGGGSAWIGACPVDPSPASSAADFYARRLGELAGRCGLGDRVERLARSGRLEELLAPVAGAPSVVHGDLWWGNVLWGADGRPWVIDPSVHGGCAEEDLAMLRLFAPVPDRTLAAYREVRPLPDGAAVRCSLFRLVPLLVHTVLFAGAYRSQAMATLVAVETA